MPITKVTNIQTLQSIMVDILLGKEMVSEILQLIKIYTIPVTTLTTEGTFSALHE